MPPRPKARPTAPPPKQERVELIASLMARGEYRTYLTIIVLREKWGLSCGTLARDAAEASRLLRIGPEQREAYQAEARAWFDAVAHRALANRSKVTGLPDYRSAILAREQAARFAGIRVDDEAPPAYGEALGEAELLRRVMDIVARARAPEQTTAAVTASIEPDTGDAKP